MATRGLCQAFLYVARSCVAGWLVSHIALAAEPERLGGLGEFARLSRDFCADCHSGAAAESGIDVVRLSHQPLVEHFSDWRRIRLALEERSMPPSDGEPLPDAARQQMIAVIDQSQRRLLAEHADDPGPNQVRRLTSAEFDYCIEDLIGLQLNLGRHFVSDNVGGSGFTNSATAQFMQDATLERYLEAAKRVSEHAMLGAGPLYFFEAPGQTGFELSAIRRIQAIYRRYGFRSAAGEGAEPFGLHRFALAFETAWRYRYRKALGLTDNSLQQLAEEAQLEPKFAQHIWQVLHREQAPFPLSDIIDRWMAFPSPPELANDPQRMEAEIAERSQALFDKMSDWQNRFAGSANAEEEAAVLAGGEFNLPAQVNFVARANRKRKREPDTFTPDLNDARLYSADGTVRFELSVEPASREIHGTPAVIFSEPQFRFRVADGVQPDPLPLVRVLDARNAAQLNLGENPGGETIGAADFSLRSGQSLTLEIELPPDCRLGELCLTARLDSRLGKNCVVRCAVKDVTSERGRSFSSLLRDPHSSGMDEWEAGLAEFARALPQISHREPAPSDRDPIPAPYNNTYNLPERNFFHTAVKYHRQDDFLYEHILPEQAARELEQAWADLLTSFDYYDVNLRFVCEKFGLVAPRRHIGEVDDKWLQAIDDGTARELIASWRSESRRLHALRSEAEQLHLKNLFDLASRSWRRPLTVVEEQDLHAFYQQSRELRGLTHAEAVRAGVVRILVSPNFLFRIEQAEEPQRGIQAASSRPLDDFELASRLSFAIWSSLPDAELLELAQQGVLHEEHVLESQMRRMLASVKSRRMATEFFGQWLGFYQFDRFRGVDPQRFPEFDDRLKHALYREAIDFSAHIIQSDRPYHEIIDADYTWLTREAAAHYGLDWDDALHGDSSHRFDTTSLQRGGVLGLAAILTSTSAPLRTSPVKRGDWILRRILGTPVPPPPADAGSIPAEEVLADGKTVRQRLEAHRARAECVSCHARIDPLGFTLEHFDSLGRWRDTYADGQEIDASSVSPDGRSLEGLHGLKNYLTSRDALLRRTFAAKLVAYVLGRAETIADAALVERIMSALERDPRFSTAMRTIVSSPQFQELRGDQ